VLAHVEKKRCGADNDRGGSLCFGGREKIKRQSQGRGGSKSRGTLHINCGFKREKRGDLKGLF